MYFTIYQKVGASKKRYELDNEIVGDELVSCELVSKCFPTRSTRFNGGAVVNPETVNVFVVPSYAVNPTSQCCK